MRILFWTARYLPSIGGVEVQTAQLIQGLVARGHEVEVITSHGGQIRPDEDEWEGVPVHRLHLDRALSLGEAGHAAANIAAVAALKRRIQPDIIHIHLTDPSPFFHLRTAGAAPVPSVVSVRVSVRGFDGGQTLLASLLRSAGAVTADSAAALEAVLAVCPEVADRASVMPNALPDPGVPRTPVRLAPLVLVAVGRMVADKGFDVAVRAMPAILERHPEAVLRLIGGGPERGPLGALAAELGVEAAVELPGLVPPHELAGVLAEASVVLVPSRWEEAFGLVALQAAQMGRPVIASAVGGLPDVVADGHTGLLVPEEDPAALASAVLTLAGDRALAQRLADAAVERVASTFSFEAHVDAHEALYAGLVS